MIRGIKRRRDVVRKTRIIIVGVKGLIRGRINCNIINSTEAITG